MSNLGNPKSASTVKNNRIDSAFATLKVDQHKAFIPYLAAGVPSDASTVRLCLQLEKAGADIIELGFPFSDPMADGPVNQEAANLALAKGVNAKRYFAMVREIRKESQVPLIVFTYLNPLYAYGLNKFVVDAKAAGADGILIVDMPIEEADEFLAQCKQSEMHCIFLVAPTTTPKRLKKIREQSGGFLYYISRTGVTGERDGFPSDFESRLSAVREGSPLPLVVGFGISKVTHVAKACALSDGVAVGSALVKQTLSDQSETQIEKALMDIALPLIQETKKSWINLG